MKPNKSFYSGQYYLNNTLLLCAARLIDSVGSRVYPRFRRKKKRPDIGEIKKVLLCRNDHLGDLLMAIPVIGAIHKALPQAELHMVVSSAAKPWLNLFPEVEKFYFFDHFYLNRERVSSAAKIRKMCAQVPSFVRDITAEGFDLAIDLRPYAGNIIPLLRMSKVGYLVGYPNSGFGFLLDHEITFDPKVHFTDNMFNCFESVYSDVNLSKDFAKISCDSIVLGSASAILESNRIMHGTDYIVIHPFSGNSCKMWTTSGWIWLMNKIGKEHGIPLVMIGSKEEQKFFLEIEAGLDVEYANLIGKTEASQVVGILAGCNMLIGIDSVAMHIASAMGKSSLCIATGIQKVVMWKPKGPYCRVVTHDVDCSPCHLGAGCDNMKCIRMIEPAKVYDEISQCPSLKRAVVTRPMNVPNTEIGGCHDSCDRW